MPTCTRCTSYSPLYPLVDEAGSGQVCGLCVIVLLGELARDGLTLSLVLSRTAELAA